MSAPEGRPLGYEAAREQLVDVVRRLEAGGTTLEESITLWERAEELAAICQAWLEGARARLDAAMAGTDAAMAGTDADAPAVASGDPEAGPDAGGARR